MGILERSGIPNDPRWVAYSIFTMRRRKANQSIEEFGLEFYAELIRSQDETLNMKYLPDDNEMLNKHYKNRANVHMHEIGNLVQ